MNIQEQTVDKIKEYIDNLMTVDISEASEFVDKLFESPRYHTEKAFALLYHLKKARIFSVFGNFYEAIYHGQQGILLAEASADWLAMCQCYNVLGTMYMDIGLINRALEMFISITHIAHEKKHYRFEALALNNIGELYNKAGATEEALSLYKTAFEKILPYQNDKSFLELGVVILLNMANHYALLDDLVEAGQQIELAYRFTKGDISKSIKSFFEEVNILICYKKGDYSNMKKSFEIACSLCRLLGDNRNLINIVARYVKFCLTLDFDIQSLIDILKTVTDNNQYKYTSEMLVIYDLLIVCYKKTHSEINVLASLKQYHLLSEQLKYLTDRHQVDAMNIHIEIDKFSHENAKITRRNQSLKEVTSEINEHSKTLIKLNHHISLITEIGRRLLSEQDINYIIDLVYQNLLKEMPIDAYYVIITSANKDVVYSVSHYYEGKPSFYFQLNIDEASGLAVRSFKTGEVYVINSAEDVRYRFASRSIKERKCQSLIYMPLVFEEQTIGVISVQSKNSNSYTDEHIDTLRSICTYLSIAVNNTKKSQQLKEEIVAKVKSQRELEALNVELKELSHKDALTKVSNRRAFTESYNLFCKRAIKAQCAISVIMIDIDYFKDFNDNYGHVKGDEVLILVAKKLNKAFYDDTMHFARYGGEEFVGVFLDCSIKKLHQLLQQLRIAVSELGIINEKTPTGFLTVSVGAVQGYLKDLAEGQTLLSVADQNLYRAKDKGRNCVVLSE